MNRSWTEHELLIALSLYCRLPFGQCNSRNKLVNEVASKMARTSGSVSRKLGNIASLDPRHQARGVGGLPNNSKLDRMVWAEFQDNWSAMADKSEAAFGALMGESAQEELAPGLERQLGPSEIERLTKTRRLQTFFRNAILSSYENRCALTGIAVPQLLVASHIIPWSENENRRADPTNGLCLNALHDKAFDLHLITFDEDLRLVVSVAISKGSGQATHLISQHNLSKSRHFLRLILVFRCQNPSLIHLGGKTVKAAARNVANNVPTCGQGKNVTISPRVLINHSRQSSIIQ